MKTEKKILHITCHLGGGVGKAIAGMVKGGPEYQHTIILLDEPQELKYLRGLTGNNILILSQLSQREIHSEIESADVTIINWWGHPLMARFLTDFNSDINCRLIIWNHINGCVYPYLPYEFLNFFSHIFFTSRYSYENTLWSETEAQEIREKSSLIYGIGDFHPGEIVPKDDYSVNAVFNVGYVGTLNYGKLSSHYVAWCEEVAQMIPNIHFLLVGNMSDEVRMDIEKSNIKDKFEVVGYVENIEEYYKKFDVFGYILNRDNYGTTENVILEAMSYGLPVIVADNEVEMHIVKHNSNGYVVNSGQDFANKLYDLYNNMQERERLGRNAREFVLKEYDSRSNCNKFYEVCETFMMENKKTYNFQGVLPSRPIDLFLYFAQDEGSVFKKYLAGDVTKRELSMCKKIFKEKSKSSIIQYAEYFPDDEDLKYLSEEIQSAY